MVNCTFEECYKKLNFPEQIAGKCDHCKMVFCPKHRGPDFHKCPNIKDAIRKKSIQQKCKPKFVNYKRCGQIGS